MANKFLDLAGLTRFKQKMVEYIEGVIESLKQSISTTYSTKTELEETDEVTQGIYDAFKQFNSENGIQ
jgi:hypothetical protein|nr:MAG TPA: hypothetical protein [Caudoviricetes sp.]